MLKFDQKTIKILNQLQPVFAVDSSTKVIRKLIMLGIIAAQEMDTKHTVTVGTKVISLNN